MPTSNSDQPSHGDPAKCWCLFDHPLTDEARAAVRDQLDYARKVQDPQGMLIHLIRLTGDCPARTRDQSGQAEDSGRSPRGEGPAEVAE